MSIIRCVVFAMATLAFAGPGHAGTLEDWLAWRLEDHERELEQQLGVEFGDGASLDDVLLRGPDGWLPHETAEPPGNLVLRRTLVPPRIGMAASVGDGPVPSWQLTLTLTFTTRRVVYQRPVRSLGAPAPMILTERSGHPALDRLLWSLAQAERQARVGGMVP